MILEMNSRELHSFEMLAALDVRLISGAEPLKPRLQTIPNGWRDFRLAMSKIGRIVEEIYKTMPPQRIRYMQALCEHGEILIRVKPAAKSDENLLIPVSALKTLVNHATSEHCTMCFKSRAEVKSCELRKSLIETAPPVDLTLGECPYRYVVENSDRGQYI